MGAGCITVVTQSMAGRGDVRNTDTLKDMAAGEVGQPGSFKETATNLKTRRRQNWLRSSQPLCCNKCSESSNKVSRKETYSTGQQAQSCKKC